MRLIQYVLICTLIFSLIGCAQQDNTLQPVKLKPIYQQLTLKTLWQQQVGSGSDDEFLRLKPTISGQTIYAVSYNGQIKAFDRYNGKVKWQQNLPQNITSGLTAGDKAIYVGTQEGELYALSQKDGHVIWHHTVANSVLATPTYADKQVFAKSLDGTIAAYSAHSGQRQWRYQNNVPVIRLYVAGQPRVVGKRVVAGFASGQVLAFNRHSGQLLWQQQVAYPKGSNPVQQMVDVAVAPQVSDDHIFVASFQGKAAALDLQTGHPIWRHDLSAYAGIAKGLDHLFIVDAQGHIWSLKADNGMVDWHNQSLQGRRLSGPTLHNHHLYVGDLDGYLHVLNSSDGDALARIQAVDSAIVAPPLIKGDTAYIYSQNGQLAAVKLP